MKNINYSIKKQFKISDEGICLLPILLRTLYRLTKKQLLLLEEIYSNYSSSTEGAIITQSHQTVNAKRIPTSFSYEGDITLNTEKLHYSSPSEKLATTWKNILFHTISIRIIIGFHKSNMEPSEWRGIIHQNIYQKFHRRHKRRLPLSFRERYTQYKNKVSDAFNQDAPK
ncbi:hypothetical protein [Bacteroides fragilis]|uniref:hypothetical protein n=1 Tax=Bacteroides fragilis TaxID=817 RepID=UPI001C701ABE|nr:hypothetical protein [Bacteroides fragilis]MBW9279802.1 hypothetical protein [Bacteroides fragilis]